MFIAIFVSLFAFYTFRKRNVITAFQQEREESCLINEYKFDAKEGDEGDKLDKGLSLILFTLDLDSNPPW